MGTGYTENELNGLRARLSEAERKWEKAARPAHLCGWVPTKLDDEPDVWYVPEKSVVIGVAAYEMVDGGKAFMPCGLTLRFPRSAGVRDDKSWHECETYDDLSRRFKDGKAKVAMSKRTAAEVAAGGSDMQYGGAGGRRNKKEGGGKAARTVGVLSHMIIDPTALGRTEKRSTILEGVVAVFRGFGGRPDSPRSVAALQQLVAAHGGTVRAHPMAETTHVIDVDETPGAQVALMIRAARSSEAPYDIVRAEWLLDCDACGNRVELEPRYILYASVATREAMHATMDEYGDRYMEEATSESLERAARLALAEARRSSLPHEGQTSLSSTDASASAAVSAGHLTLRDSDAAATAYPSAIDDSIVVELLKQLPDADVASLTATRTTMLIGVVAYAPRAPTRIRLRLAGARVVDVPTAATTHAVLPAGFVGDGTAANVRSALSHARVAAWEEGGGVTAWLVDEAWLDACEQQGSRAKENPFAIHEAASGT